MPVRDTLATKMRNKDGDVVQVHSFSPLSVLQSIVSDKVMLHALQPPSLKGTLTGETVFVGLPHEGRLAGTDPRFGPTIWKRPTGVRYFFYPSINSQSREP